MKIKRLLRRIPFLVPVYKRIATLARNRSNNIILKQLKNTPYRLGVQLKETLESLRRALPESEQDWIKRIEVERKRLLRRNDLLNDGSLGDGWSYNKDMSIKRACQGSKPPKPALMLYLLTRAIKPKTVIELGTNVGISSAYIGVALKVNGQNGTMRTLEGSPYSQRLAKEVHRNLGIDNISYAEGFFKDTLSPSLAELGSIDMAFVDGHHHYQPTLDYFEEILKFSTPETVFVFDDIRWSDGMKRAWSEIQSDDRLGLIVDITSIGVCVRRQEEDSQRFVFDPIYVF